MAAEASWLPSPDCGCGHTCSASSLELTVDLRPQHRGRSWASGPVLCWGCQLLVTCLVTVWSIALHRQMWWGSCPICWTSTDSSFFFIPNAGLIWPLSPLGTQKMNAWPEDLKPTFCFVPLKLFISFPLHEFSWIFSESIQDVKYTDWNPRVYKNGSKRHSPALHTLNYSMKWDCHTVAIGQWDPHIHFIK